MHTAIIYSLHIEKVLVHYLKINQLSATAGCCQQMAPKAVHRIYWQTLHVQGGKGGQYQEYMSSGWCYPYHLDLCLAIQIYGIISTMLSCVL